MRLADGYDPTELPTRPDNPKTVATRCQSCGQVYGDHSVTRPGTTHGPRFPAMLRAACCGQRRNFQPENVRPADVER